MHFVFSILLLCLVNSIISSSDQVDVDVDDDVYVLVGMLGQPNIPIIGIPSSINANASSTVRPPYVRVKILSYRRSDRDCPSHEEQLRVQLSLNATTRGQRGC
jgi:hypothetical protein